MSNKLVSNEWWGAQNRIKKTSRTKITVSNLVRDQFNDQRFTVMHVFVYLDICCC